jgi:3-oxoacid CoA-transferase B subunit
LKKEGISHEAMGMRVAKEFFDGAYVNLGGGMAGSYAFASAASSLEDHKVILQSENGVLGYGRPFTVDERERWDIDYINATSNFVEVLPGMSIFDHAQAFDMIRGRHLDFTVMGAYQVSEKGDLANWATDAWLDKDGDVKIGSVGGAMDLALGAKKVIVMMEHVTKDGELRILKKCTYPLTGVKCINLIVTDLAVMEVTKTGMVLKEMAPGWTAEEVQSLTEAKLIVPKDLKEIEL